MRSRASSSASTATSSSTSSSPPSLSHLTSTQVLLAKTTHLLSLTISTISSHTGVTQRTLSKPSLHSPPSFSTHPASFWADLFSSARTLLDLAESAILSPPSPPSPPSFPWLDTTPLNREVRALLNNSATLVDAVTSSAPSLSTSASMPLDEHDVLYGPDTTTPPLSTAAFDYYTSLVSYSSSHPLGQLAAAFLAAHPTPSPPTIKRFIAHLHFLTISSCPLLSKLRRLGLPPHQTDRLASNINAVAHAAVSDSLISPLYPMLMDHYRASNEELDAAALEHAKTLPFHAIAAPFFLLLPGSAPTYKHLSRTKITSPPTTRIDPDHVPDYSLSVSLLQRIPGADSAQRKADLVAMACRSVSTSITTHYDNFVEASDLMLNADELISVLTLCLVQAAIPDLVSQTHFISDWLSASAAMGEHGFCVTTLQCAVRYLFQLADDPAPVTFTSMPSLPDAPNTPAPTPPPPSPAPSPAAAYERMASEGIKRLLSLSSLADWSEASFTDGVRIYRRSVSNNSIQCVKGEGVIPADAGSIIKLLVEPTSRQVFDPMCLSSSLVQRIDDHTNIVHLAFKAVRWCATTYRDFCVLVHWRRLPDNSYVLFGRSVRHRACPPEGRFVRGKIMFSGWLLRPRASDPNITDATYLLHLDVGGRAPSWLKNMIIVKQPLLINELADFFSSSQIT